MPLTNPTELIGMLVGLLLTLLVFSYVLGDNPLFRLAVHLFVGVSAGFAAAVAVRNVILPNLFLPFLTGEGGLMGMLLAAVPLVLSLLMLGKISKRFRTLGNLPVAFLVGVGAAAAIGGAITGTLFPQVDTTIALMDVMTVASPDAFGGLVEIVSRGVSFVGTLAALAYFHFGAKSVPNAPAERNPWLELTAQIGHLFIAVTFGVIFAGVFSASVAALVERMNAIMSLIRVFF
jgi:hypothetical protein